MYRVAKLLMRAFAVGGKGASEESKLDANGQAIGRCQQRLCSWDTEASGSTLTAAATTIHVHVSGFGDDAWTITKGQ